MNFNFVLGNFRALIISKKCHDKLPYNYYHHHFLSSLEFPTTPIVLNGLANKIRIEMLF